MVLPPFFLMCVLVCRHAMPLRLCVEYSAPIEWKGRVTLQQFFLSETSMTFKTSARMVRRSFWGIVMMLGACGYSDSRLAHKAQLSLLGATSRDLMACAGIPAGTKSLEDGTQIYTYTGTHTLPSYNSTLLPVGDAVNILKDAMGGNGTTCTAVIQLEHDRVTDVHYAGDNDEVIGVDGICSTIMRGCMRQPTASMRNVDGGLFGPVSAFHAPQNLPRAAASLQPAQPAASVPPDPATGKETTGKAGGPHGTP